MERDGRIDQVAPKGPKAGEDSILIRASKPRIADHVGHQDRRELSSLAHGASAEARSPVTSGMGMAALPCCTEGRGSGSAAPRIDWPVYPRRVEHSTVVKGEKTGIDGRASARFSG
jgi:hypothetical protein